MRWTNFKIWIYKILHKGNPDGYAYTVKTTSEKHYWLVRYHYAAWDCVGIKQLRDVTWTTDRESVNRMYEYYKKDINAFIVYRYTD